MEPYFLRKLYMKLVIETPEKLLVNKEKSHSFLSWMEERQPVFLPAVYSRLEAENVYLVAFLLT